MKNIIFCALIIQTLLLFCFFFPVNLALSGSCPEGQICLDDPLATGDVHTTPQALIGRIINAVLGIVGSIALAMFIYGGFTWMTSSGNSEKVQKGKDILIWAALGLVVIFASYALVNFVIFTAIKGGA
ncbi:hypothetical protein KAU19_05550 [Candidatus Parcubacteria bacterium]|nr:hypothetical protein [Candidatus Parcubacteria bacterium]